MAKNKLSDLNDHLFAQLERLSEENLTPEEIDKEVKRAGAVTSVAAHIIQNAQVTVEAVKLISKGDIVGSSLPETFGMQKVKSLDH